MKPIRIMSSGAAILIFATGCATLSRSSTPPATSDFKNSFYREFPSPLLTARDGRIDFAAFWCANRPADIPPAEICDD